jgi:hypothetical protein
MERETDQQRLDRCANTVAETIQDLTHCSDRSMKYLKQVLIAFAEEIKRQAIEPESGNGT